MGYKIGLDIGISSIGYAVLETDESGNPFKIRHLNSVIFTPAEHPKTGDSLAAPRREKRGSRRRNRRTNFRKYRTKQLFIRHGLLVGTEIEEILAGKHGDESVYELRVKALDEVVTPEEMFRILYFFVAHRGFKSNRKSELTEKDNGPVLSSIKKRQAILAEKNYRTIGEYLLKDDAYQEQKRNSADNFLGTVQRDMLISEIELIFENQVELGNKAYSTEFMTDYVDTENPTAIFNGQRDFDAGPGAGPYSGNQIEKMIGFCTFEPKEKRAAKSTHTFQLFNLLSKINNLKIQEIEGKGYRELYEAERLIIRDRAYSTTKVTYSQIKKALDLPIHAKFNLLNYGSKTAQKTTENATFIALKDYHSIKNTLPQAIYDPLTSYELDEIGRILSSYSGDASRREAFNNYTSLSYDNIEALLPLTMSGFGSLSLVAMRRLIPHLEAGLTYDKACEAVGYDFRQNNVDADYIHQNVTNPVVKRAVSQTIKVVNNIVREYGKPDSISIELARDLGRTHEDRRKMQKRFEENAARNERVAERIRELGFSVNGENIIRFKLWEEQKEFDPYTGKPIPLERVFTHEYDVDHIIPYSISFDDSFGNKLLINTAANREKGNRIPLEYLGDNERKVKVFKETVALIGNYRKREKLMKEKLSDEDRDEWKSRNLNDTRYISRLLKSYFANENNIEYSEAVAKRQRVDTVSGGVTAKIRGRWGFNKMRHEGDKHHALDAVVIACITPKYVKEVTNFSKRLEVKGNPDLWKTKDLLEELEKEVVKSKHDYERIFNQAFPLPWEGFRDEVFARMSENPKEMMKDARVTTYTEDEIESLKPMFVVRKPNRKVTGAAHLDTIRSAKRLAEGVTISRVAIDKLKLNKKGDIVSGNMSFDQTEDEGWRLNYNALKLELEKHDGDGAKAFPDKHFTFEHNGQSHTVKRVKMLKKSTLQVELDINKETDEPNSAADNGSMVRIDVFKVFNAKGKSKYMFVPIYVNDTIEEQLPNRAVVRKAFIDWPEMYEEDFIFSLYPNDMIHIKHTDGFTPKYNGDVKNKEEVIKDFWGYFVGANIATASITIRAHDNSYTVGSLGIATLEDFLKYQVDYFGNYYKVTEKQRQTFN